MKDAHLVLHQYPVSPFAAKVRRALRYKRLSFEVRNYAVAQAGAIKKTVSPTGKTPVLEHAGELIVDSTDILRYLDATYPEQPIYPADSRLRAQVHIIEDWADESLFFYDLTMRLWDHNVDWLVRDVLAGDKGIFRALMNRALPGFFKKAVTAQGIGRKSQQTVIDEVSQHFDAIEAMLTDAEFLVGDALSVADIAVVSMCTVLERAREADQLMQQRPALMAWRERVDALTLPEGTSAEQRATA